MQPCEMQREPPVRSNRDDVVPYWVQGLTVINMYVSLQSTEYELTCLNVHIIINSTDSRV
jgi:hypothetical protein